jgi:hypothetical protein
LLTGVLLANMPVSPPFRVGAVLVAIVAVEGLFSFLLASLLHGVPQVLVGAIGLVVFLTLVVMAQGKAMLPGLLMLLSIAVVPIVAMVYPAQASSFPIALVRAMAVAVIILWCMHAIWPCVAPPASPPPGEMLASPVATAIMGTAAIMPLVLVYLLYDMTDVLPGLITTILMVINLDPGRGRAYGVAVLLGNLAGGAAGLAAYLLLGVAPSLLTLGILTFLIGIGFATFIARGGTGGVVALIGCNASLVILSSALASGPTSSGIWLARLSQLALAWIFAAGMMSLVWRKDRGGAADEA